jgi:hypothetical protein
MAVASAYPPPLLLVTMAGTAFVVVSPLARSCPRASCQAAR